MEVLSVYPDFERWPASHIRFVYEENPGMDVASVDGKSREEKIAALERALVKPYSVDAHDGSGEKQKFVALMLPADPAAADPAAADPATAAETEYEWIREYEYKLTQERESGLGTCAFYFYEKDKTARYVELDAKMSLTRRSKTAKRAEGAEWRPSKVTLKRPRRTTPRQSTRQGARRGGTSGAGRRWGGGWNERADEEKHKREDLLSCDIYVLRNPTVCNSATIASVLRSCRRATKRAPRLRIAALRRLLSRFEPEDYPFRTSSPRRPSPSGFRPYMCRCRCRTRRRTRRCTPAERWANRVYTFDLSRAQALVLEDVDRLERHLHALEDLNDGVGEATSGASLLLS